MLAIIGAVMVVGAAVLIKLYDSEIRKSQWKKAAINFSVIAGVLLVFVGLIMLFIS